jgi:diacylglycerol kinase (ATP)
MPLSKEDILFIVNPVAGKGNYKYTISRIYEHADLKKYNIVIEIAAYKGHASKIAEDYRKKGIKNIVAVGGDGTINEIGAAIVNTGISLGIIPRGSGNGLARYLSIPLNAGNALKVINDNKTKIIDAATINDKYFFCTSGVGLDARVGIIFDKSKKRGSMNYFKATVSEFLTYKPKKYKLKIDNNSRRKVRSLLITFANAGQYGNNAYISPDARIDDGLLDLCILKPFPKSFMLPIGLRLISKTLNKSKYLEVVKCKEIILKRKKNIKFHYDGEPCKAGKKITVKIMPASLKVIVP